MEADNSTSILSGNKDEDGIRMTVIVFTRFKIGSRMCVVEKSGKALILGHLWNCQGKK